MKEFNKNAIGLAVGIISAIGHFLWVVAVVIGFAETLLIWWNTKHFVNYNLAITQFSFSIAILGTLSAFIVGYITGWLFAWIYNKIA